MPDTRHIKELLANPGRITTDDISLAYVGARRSIVHVTTQENEFWHRRDADRFSTWDAILLSGKNYLVGESVELVDFLQSHTSRLPHWMQLAWHWCQRYPQRALSVTSHRFEWDVGKRGEFVEFGLPHHDKGGERHWASRDGKTKVLINVD